MGTISPLTVVPSVITPCTVELSSVDVETINSSINSSGDSVLPPASLIVVALIEDELETGVVESVVPSLEVVVNASIFSPIACCPPTPRSAAVDDSSEVVVYAVELTATCDVVVVVVVVDVDVLLVVVVVVVVVLVVVVKDEVVEVGLIVVVGVFLLHRFSRKHLNIHCGALLKPCLFSGNRHACQHSAYCSFHPHCILVFALTKMS